MSPMPAYAYAVLALGTLAWLAPFVLARRQSAPAKQIDRRARWGILVVALGYSLLWQNRFWERPVPLWRLILAGVFLLLASLLSWASTRALGRHWRLDAGLNPDHQLVTSGPYRLVRHPIYTSMLCDALGTGFMITPLWVLPVAVAVYLAGTEIRVRSEERLLASRFGEAFRDYQRRVPAYIPFS
jgi:protein-S-isoprenylcysteine O-methyltransferase Ste14